MGAKCSRRRSEAVEVLVEDEDWEVIAANPPAAVRAVRFRQAVIKVKNLLIVRQIWASLGRQLQHPSTSRYLVYDRQQGITTWKDTRTKTRPLWAAIGRYLQLYAELFKHLERKNGKLVYRRR